MRKGFTLVELLVSLAVFSILGATATFVFANAIRAYRDAREEKALSNDAYFVMQKIEQALKESTIDYEEYYNQMHKSKIDFGATYGEYAKKFYDCGTPNQAGVQCKNDADPSDPSCAVAPETIDKNLGKGKLESDCALCNGGNVETVQSNLYLISLDGKKKTIFAPEMIDISGEKTLSMLRMTGLDTDQNGIPEKFFPDAEFACVGEAKNDLTNTEKFPDEDQCFLPIISKKSVVKSLSFEILPPEDPFKAFAENPSYLIQPQVKIALTLASTHNPLRTFTLERAMMSGVKTEVPSFPALRGMSCL